LALDELVELGVITLPRGSVGHMLHPLQMLFIVDGFCLGIQLAHERQVLGVVCVFPVVVDAVEFDFGGHVAVAGGRDLLG